MQVSLHFFGLFCILLILVLQAVIKLNFSFLLLLELNFSLTSEKTYNTMLWILITLLQLFQNLRYIIYTLLFRCLSKTVI